MRLSMTRPRNTISVFFPSRVVEVCIVEIVSLTVVSWIQDCTEMRSRKERDGKIMGQCTLDSRKRVFPDLCVFYLHVNDEELDEVSILAEGGERSLKVDGGSKLRDWTLEERHKLLSVFGSTNAIEFPTLMQTVMGEISLRARAVRVGRQTRSSLQIGTISTLVVRQENITCRQT
jgi:hypothetical protein